MQQARDMCVQQARKGYAKEFQVGPQRNFFSVVFFLYFLFFFTSGVLHFMNIMINAIKRDWTHTEILENFERKIGFSEFKMI